MIISSPELQTTYREAGKIATDILYQVMQKVEPGVFTIELEEHAQKLCKKHNVEPSFAPVSNEFGPYDHAMCISVNEAVLHGLPNHEIPIKEGDLVKLDFGIIYQDLCTDQCVTVGVKKLSKKNKKLIEIGKEAVLTAVRIATTGNRTGDLGYMMHSTSKKNGYDVLKQYIGHGIGHSLHENPAIPAYGRPNTGSLLKKDMVICVEAQVLSGSDQTYVTDDSWTIKMKDGKNTAMFEYMVRVDDLEPEILTPTTNWPLITS